MYRFVYASVLGTPESEIVLLQALEHMRSQTAEQLYKMKHEKQFADVDWDMLTEYLPDKLVQEMDAKRRTTIHRKLSVSRSRSVISPPPANQLRAVANDNELLESSSIHETDSISNELFSGQQDVLRDNFALPTFDFQATDNKQNQNIRNELITRFLTALSVDYEKQWYLGMIRRRTLYILIKSVEKAKHQYSLKLHWQSILEQFRWSVFLRYLMRFNNIQWINKQVNELLFDHIFLAIELILGKYYNDHQAHMILKILFCAFCSFSFCQNTYGQYKNTIS